MRMMTKLSALLAVLMLALTLGRSGVAAQDAPMAPFEVGDLDGIQAAVSRTYTVDVSGMLDSIGTPGPDGEMGEIPELSGVVTMIGVIGQFDSSDNAAAAVERVDEESTAALAEEEDAPELTEAEVDLGDTSRAYSATQEIEGQALNLSVLIVQQDEYLYFVVAGVIDADAQQLATDFTQALIEGEAGDGEPQVKEDGTSTGGLWDKFPAADDELVANLTAFDEQLYPEVESTPAP
jgi:hypothetical protein